MRKLSLLIVAFASLVPPAQAEVLEARDVLPPGQSGYVSIDGVADGTGSPHLTDQIELFSSFEYKPHTFNQPGEIETPRPGVEIVRDAYGVPAITGDTDFDAWWGVGYAVAKALTEAGHDPEVVKVRGLGIGPSFMHLITEGRREVEELTGQHAVPVLVTDSGEAISDSKRIAAWAEANPATG